MSLEQAIKHGKEHRKGYRERVLFGSGDATCRPHGACGYCRTNRLFAQRRLRAVERFEREYSEKS